MQPACSCQCWSSRWSVQQLTLSGLCPRLLLVVLVMVVAAVVLLLLVVVSRMVLKALQQATAAVVQQAPVGLPATTVTPLALSGQRLGYKLCCLLVLPAPTSGQSCSHKPSNSNSSRSSNSRHKSKSSRSYSYP